MHIIPQLRDLQTRFGNSLVVIGVHSPKFAAEQSDADVRAAVARYHLDHPVVNDSHLTLWRTLGVQAWPTVVLVDPDGYVAHVVEGEGVEAGMLPALTQIANLYRAAGRLNERPLALSLESSKYKPTLLSFPGKILADAAGKRFFIADSGHNRIVVAGVDGRVQEIIGSGKQGRADGSYSAASFHNPQGIALVGNILYVADTNNHLIRAVDLHNHTVATVAGTGRQAAPTDTGGPALREAISSPWDVNWFRGALYIAMAGDHRIWRYDPTSKWVGVYAGTGVEARQDGVLQQAEFAQPSGLANDGRYLYVADSESSSIRRIEPVAGLVTTLAGGDLFDFGHTDATGLEAKFQHPLGIAYLTGKLYIADTYNSDIRVLDLANRAVTTLAGATVAGNTDGKSARFFEPGGLTVYDGKLYVADTDNGAIRVVDPGTAATTTLAVSTTPAGPSPTAAPQSDTGVAGTVSIGPVTPVSRVGEVNERPYEASLELRDVSGAVVARGSSGADGRFFIEAPPGTYNLVPLHPQIMPRANPMPVTVSAHQITTVHISYDSGIR